MQCPHCQAVVDGPWMSRPFERNRLAIPGLFYRTFACVECEQLTVEMSASNGLDWRRIYPEDRRRPSPQPDLSVSANG